MDMYIVQKVSILRHPLPSTAAKAVKGSGLRQTCACVRMTGAVFVVVLALSGRAVEWHDDYFSARIPVLLNAEQAGQQVVGIDPCTVTSWINESAEFPFESQSFAHDAVRLVDEAGRAIAGTFEICPGAELVVNGGFERVSDGLPADWKLSTREGFAVVAADGGHVLDVRGGDQHACYQEIPLASNTWYRFSYRAMGKNGPVPSIMAKTGSGLSWTPVERSCFDPLITHDTWRERVIYFHTGDQRRWGNDQFTVRVLRFDGQVDDISLRPCQVAFVADLPTSGQISAHLYYSPYEGPLPAPPGREIETLPAATAAFSRTGPVEWLDDRLSCVVGESKVGDLWWIPTTRKWQPGAQAPTTRTNAVRLACARNEAEPLQLLFHARTAARIESVAVALTGPGGVTLSPECFDLRLGHYIPILKPSTYAYGKLGRAPRFNYTGQLPDPLTTFVPLDVAPDQPPVPIWIDIAVPVDAAPGMYTGMIEVRAGEETITVPLQLRVWNFELPVRPTCRTAFGLDQYANQFLFPFHKIETQEEKYALSRAYIDTSVRYKISPKGVASAYHYHPEVISPINFSNVETLLDAYRAEIPWGLDEIQASSMLVAHWCGPSLARNLTVEDGQREAQRLERISRLLETGGWLDRAFVWIDEPRPNAYAMLRSWVGSLKEQPHAQNLKIFPLVYNGDAYEGLGDIADMMAFWDGEYSASTFSPAYARSASRTFEPWCYYTRCVHLWIDTPGMNQRLWAPKVFAMGGRGIAMWAMLQWWSSDNSPHTVRNPWEDPATTWGNGALAFFYPPSPLGKDLPAKDLSIVPSLRMLLARDGIDDFEYGAMLERIVDDRPEMAAEAEELLAAMRRPFVSSVHWTLCQTYWQNTRARVGEFLAAANDRGE